MRRHRPGGLLSRVNTGLLLFGLALVLALGLGSQVTVEGTQLSQGVAWWQRLLGIVVGVLLIAWAVLSGREPVPGLWSGRGFLGAQPQLPAQLVHRPDLSKQIVRALRSRPRSVAVVGIGGAGKSTLAAQACTHWRVRRRFRGGVTWLAAGPRADPLALLATLGRRLGVAGADAGFASLQLAQDALASALGSKHVLAAVDNVWERGPLDALRGIGPSCTVIFTTRKSELASTLAAAAVEVDQLSPEQAHALLAHWTGMPPSSLPSLARELCARVGNLALGVAMAGAMVARGRSFGDVLALINEDLAQVRAELDPEYQYATLRAAIEAGISILPNPEQRRYGQLAVFRDRGLFHRTAAEVLWRADLSAAGVGDLLARLTGWSLLTAAGDDWYTAHDLQYEVLGGRLSTAQLTAAHAQLVDGYRATYPSGWSAATKDPYLAGALAAHLHDAHLSAELGSLLADQQWIRARVVQGQLNDLLTDYSYANDQLTRQIGRALQRSAPALTTHPEEVTGQLGGRLLGDPDGAVRGWGLAFDYRAGSGQRLVPIRPAFAEADPPDAWHGAAAAVAATPYGDRIITGGADGELQIWSMPTSLLLKGITRAGQPILSLAAFSHASHVLVGGPGGRVEVWDLIAAVRRTDLTGHVGAVRALAVLPDGSTAVSGGDDQTFRIWSLVTYAHRRTVRTGSQVRSITTAADGTMVITGGADGTVRIWNLATGQREVALPGHSGPVLCIAAGGRGGALALTGGHDGTVRLWSPVAATRIPGGPLTGHLGPVTAVAISGDGHVAVTGGQDKTVRAWDLRTRQEIAIWHGHSAITGCLALPADPLRVIIGQEDGQPYQLELRS